MKTYSLFSLFMVASLLLAGCTGAAPASPAHGTATSIASRAETAPTINLDPATGSPNTRVVVTGSGFPAGSRVALHLGATQQLYAVAVANPEGKVTIAFLVPGQLPDGADQDLAVMLANEDLSLTAAATFRVQRPTPTSPPTPRPAATPAPVQPGGPTAFVNFDFLNVRAGPGTNHDLVTKLNRNQSMSLLGRSGDSAWARVRVPGGAEGWVSTQYITATVPIASLPVIQITQPVSTPGSSATAATPIPAGEQDKAVAAAIGFYSAWASGAGQYGNLELALQYVSQSLAEEIRADNSALLRLVGVESRPRYTRVQITRFDGTTAVARATLELASGNHVVDTTLVKQDGTWVIEKFQPVAEP